MKKSPIAIVGIGAILPDAPTASTFWNNIVNKRYSISETPQDRWLISDYYDPEPRAPDKTYSKIGGWVRGFEFDWKRFRMPPKVAAAMDQSQQWAVTIAADALEDYGYPERPIDNDRTAVILGTAIGGELHYLTHLRIVFPEYARALESVAEFNQLQPSVRDAILERWHEAIDQAIPPITEDSMPGELPNVVSGRVANMLNLRGPNFITDAACAASFAAVNAGVELLNEHEVDTVLTGGVDRNMGISSFVKFCKIGALSATGTRPFGEGADGFVMGEGAAAFLLKRLEDAERDGDKIYALIRGVGGASDGKGKGITAPNPVGQQLAMRRAWENAGLDPATATLVEAHGTSTKVGDVVEVESLTEVFGAAPLGGIALGSVKSNIGHLKSGAGAAGMLKATLALHHRILPPTLNAEKPNSNIDFEKTPFYLNHQAQEWKKANGHPRRCGVSAFGFGGTNFHVVLEEYVPGQSPLADSMQATAAPGDDVAANGGSGVTVAASMTGGKMRVPFQGMLSIGAASAKELKDKLDDLLARVQGGWMPTTRYPTAADQQLPERLIIDYSDQAELLNRMLTAQKAMGFDSPQAWKAMQAQGIFRGSGSRPGKIAFLFPGQGSQYVNMGRELARLSPVVAEVFEEADRVMTPILGKPLTEYIFVDQSNRSAMMQAQLDLMQTEITQPAMLTLDFAMYRLLNSLGFKPDMVMGHSLGEYAALIASGAMPFADALEAAAARGSEMSKVSLDDNGWMAAVLAPFDVVEETLKEIDGYVVPANINSRSQSVIGGASEAVAEAIRVFEGKGYQAMQLPVSHAFHTKIVAPASGPLHQVLDRLRISSPLLPLVANVTGDFYPTTPEAIKDMLQKQVASPVQWVKGLETLYGAGVRTFVEVGPKRALRSFVNDVFAGKDDVLALITNHPKFGEVATFNQALCGLYAAGYGQVVKESAIPVTAGVQPPPVAADGGGSPAESPDKVQEERKEKEQEIRLGPETHEAIRMAVTEALEQLVGTERAWPISDEQAGRSTVNDRNAPPLGSVVISGTGLGLPGAEKAVMDPENVMRILRGEQFVDLIPGRFRRAMVEKRVTRLVKGPDGGGHFETISDPGQVVRLAGRPGPFDLAEEYGVPQKLADALDVTSQLAMAAGLDALREANIPLVQTYRRTTTGKDIPDRWLLPESLRDETGVIFASVFPGGDRFAEEFDRYYTYESRTAQLELLEELRQHTVDPGVLEELNRRIGQLRELLGDEPYSFDRRFIFRVLAMGHSQFAEYIGARGPNTQVNSACASTTQAISIAEDWIRSGRCRRVVIISGDNVTGDNLMDWVGAGFLALGAAATDDAVEEAALPFDRRRHGTLLGMGACALVVESEDAVHERGMRGIVELLSTETRNSAFHGSRLDVDHMSMVMNELVTAAERRFGLSRQAIASELVFMSHETYTPARGGSAAAEIYALRRTFGPSANEIVISNTKGFTGHPMGVGVEDVIALKILEHGIVPPVPNYKEPDPELGLLNLSRGGRYPVKYALHLAAGFGSQIAMTLTRHIPGGLDRLDNKPRYQHWVDQVSGYDRAQIEVEKRTLRVKAQGVPERPPAPSQWQYGTGPTKRVLASDGVTAGGLPLGETRSQIRPAPEPVTLTDGQSSQVKTTKISEAETAPATTVPAEPVEPPLTFPDRPVDEQDMDSPTKADEVDSKDELSVDSVAEKVLQIVAEQTGYPKEMLELDLDLEADLGVDTVKQAETFETIREAFDIPRRDDLQLRDYPTLGHVVGFIHEMRPDLVQVDKEPSPTEQMVEKPAQSVTAPPDATKESTLIDKVAGKVLEIVAEQTGYPKEMLELDLDLEADLGVDTVKQAETFVAIREAFDIPRRDDLQLRDYPTLGHVIGFIHEMRPDLVDGGGLPAATAQTVEEPMQSAQALIEPTKEVLPVDSVAETVLEIVAEQTGYPMEMLELDLDLEADLGVDTVKQAETFVAIREAFDIPRRDDLQLRDYPTLGHVIGFIHEMRPDLVQADREPSLTEQMVEEPAQSVMVPPVAAEEAASSDNVAETVLQIVAGQTGYPPEMLELDLDLEADLGVDTVKQAETFVAIREAFDIPRRDDLQLRDYPTLGHVIGFVREIQAERAGATPEALDAEPSATIAKPIVPSSLEAADSVPRRIPIPVLRPPLNVFKATGVTLDETSRVVVMGDQGGVGQTLINRLQKMGVDVLSFEGSDSVERLKERVTAWLQKGPIQGVYWLPALDAEPNLHEMDLESWRELNRQRVKNLHVLMRLVYDDIREPGTFLISATLLGGLHGYGPERATAPLGGAVTGFTKAFKQEQSQALVKSIDFELNGEFSTIVEALLAETLADPGVVEVGYWQGSRYTVGLKQEAVADGQPGLVLNQDTVFVVSGAAGGITSAIVADLAAASAGFFHLLDIADPPDPDDPQIASFRAGREVLKGQLIEAGMAAGERPTPATIERQLMAVERQEAALRAIESVQEAGGTAHYHQVDLLDGPAVSAVIEEIGRRHGRVDVLIHAAGVEISRSLANKEPSEFDLVFDVKADGFFNLMHAAQELPVGNSIVFSSVAARFGNRGQADYCAANDLLCKLNSSMGAWRPETRGIAIDWTAWDQIGMATRGSIPKIMEMAGIDLLPPETGIATLRRELIASDNHGEVIIAGKLGLLVEELDEDGGLDLEKASRWLSEQGPGLIRKSRVKAANRHTGLEIETILDPKAQPFLFDHRVGETPLLPGVMGTELFAQLAAAVAPGFNVAGVKNEQFHHPFKFYRMEPQTLHWTIMATPLADGDLIAHTVLKSARQLAREKLPLQEKIHFTADVCLTPRALDKPTMEFRAPETNAMPVAADEIYQVLFHGPAYRVLERVQVSGDKAIGLMPLSLPPDTDPPDASSLMAPRLIELCFQTAGVWQMETNGGQALPTSVGSITAYRQAPQDAERRLYALVNAMEGGDRFDARVVDENGAVYLELNDYRTVQIPEIR